MEFMNVVREKAAVLAQGAVRTSTVVVETVKSNLAIADKEAETKKILRQIGTAIYDAYKDGCEPDADILAEKCAALDEYFSEIAALKEKVNELKNTQVCKHCNSVVKADFKFCPECGKKMD